MAILWTKSLFLIIKKSSSINIYVEVGSHLSAPLSSPCLPFTLHIRKILKKETFSLRKFMMRYSWIYFETNSKTNSWLHACFWICTTFFSKTGILNFTHVINWPTLRLKITESEIGTEFIEVKVSLIHIYQKEYRRSTIMLHFG